MAHRCIMCGRIIEEWEWKNKDEDEDEDYPQKPPSFCHKCQAKLKKEADDQHKPSKPM
ncbi:MAG: hypothetical protein K9L17_04790 [Clostridiales bacterium]|nr:hypothetical protein [Clostridiales bacterium]MCF8021991.1 hypothetical protein [Clostridiales bacterium]